MKRLRANVNSFKATQATQNVDKEIGEMARELAINMANDAPILTGALRQSLANSYRHTSFLVHDTALDLDGVPYVWRQNFEHSTKRYYITRNVNALRGKFERRIRKAVASTWR
ncbi:hypothetical protein CD143_02550 [Staphylococcus felis]|nr:hypothetical protein C7J90_10815 [Staphylococcus felis]PNZ37100.1 hypothetical protein CD143_02550 [Staphylococcus felis]